LGGLALIVFFRVSVPMTVYKLAWSYVSLHVILLIEMFCCKTVNPTLDNQSEDCML